MNFLPIAILAYLFNGGSNLIQKFQLQNNELSPINYTFYVSAMQMLVIFLLPFGFSFQPTSAIAPAILSGIIFVFATYALFKALKLGEVSIVTPVIGALNPFFGFLIGAVFLNDVLTPNQLSAFFILLLGAVVLTANLWIKKISVNQALVWMIISGFLYGLSYVFLRSAFLQGNFITGLIVSRMAGGLFVISCLVFGPIRARVFDATTKNDIKTFNKTTILFLSGQAMAAIAHFLLFYGSSLANPALVNSLFGVQYLFILVVAIVLAKKHPQLLGEDLHPLALIEKIIGAGILSYGVYLLTK